MSGARQRRDRACRHASRSHTMPCGKVVFGNGGPAGHQNRCRQCLTLEGAYMPTWIQQGIFANVYEYAGGTERFSEALRETYREWKRTEGDRLLAELGKTRS